MLHGAAKKKKKDFVTREEEEGSCSVNLKIITIYWASVMCQALKGVRHFIYFIYNPVWRSNPILFPFYKCKTWSVVELESSYHSEVCWMSDWWTPIARIKIQVAPSRTPPFSPNKGLTAGRRDLTECRVKRKKRDPAILCIIFKL